MSKLRDFMRDKAVLLVLLACVVCAVGVGVWAVRTVRGQLQQDLNGVDEISGAEDYPGNDDALGGEDEWTVQPGLDVAGNVSGVPKPTTAPVPSAKPSAQPSGSGSSSASSDKSALPAVSAAPQTPAYASPVSGRLVQEYSGDELVYNPTLGDWRTHNGADYLCSAGETVFAPTAGTVTKVETGGNWGGVVELTAADGTVWRVCGVAATVKQGDKLNTGNQIGTAGTVPAESMMDDHIHLEVKKDGKYLDPSDCLN